MAGRIKRRFITMAHAVEAGDTQVVPPAFSCTMKAYEAMIKFCSWRELNERALNREQAVAYT
jgi:hypothetical protein